MNETWTVPAEPHPVDRRTVDEVRVMRLERADGHYCEVELRLRDRFAILTPTQVRQLRSALIRAYDSTSDHAR